MVGLEKSCKLLYVVMSGHRGALGVRKIENIKSGDSESKNAKNKYFHFCFLTTSLLFLLTRNFLLCGFLLGDFLRSFLFRCFFLGGFFLRHLGLGRKLLN